MILMEEQKMEVVSYDFNFVVYDETYVSKQQSSEEFRENAIVRMALQINQPIKTNSDWLKKRLIKVLKSLPG